MGGIFRNSHACWGIAAAAIVYCLDQAYKWWMLAVFEIAEGQTVTVTPFFDLVLVWNKGVSYGWLKQDTELGRWLLIGFTVIAVICLTVWLASSRNRTNGFAVGLMIGGALGNGTDRVIHGAVADFFSFHAFGFYWYIFNLADIAIVAGVVLLLYDIVAERKQATHAGDGQG